MLYKGYWDPNVSAGRISIKTVGVPVVGSKNSTKGFIQVRSDITNPNGFSWMDTQMEFRDSNTISNTVLAWQLSDILSRYRTVNAPETNFRQDILE